MLLRKGCRNRKGRVFFPHWELHRTECQQSMTERETELFGRGSVSAALYKCHYLCLLEIGCCKSVWVGKQRRALACICSLLPLHSSFGLLLCTSQCLCSPELSDSPHSRANKEKGQACWCICPVPGRVL